MAILGIAKIRKQPVVVNKEIIVQDIGNLSWSFDHRVIDGDLAASFSNYYISLLENPRKFFQVKQLELELITRDTYDETHLAKSCETFRHFV